MAPLLHLRSHSLVFSAFCVNNHEIIHQTVEIRAPDMASKACICVVFIKMYGIDDQKTDAGSSSARSLSFVNTLMLTCSLREGLVQIGTNHLLDCWVVQEG